MAEVWLLDAGTSDPPYVLAYCPYDTETGDVMVGLTMVTDNTPPGPFGGVFHPDGQEACEAWCEEHADVIASIKPASGEEGAA